MSRHKPTASIFALLLIFLSQGAVADIYKYMDRQGGLHFTDRPIKKPGFRLVWKSSGGGNRSKASGYRINTAAMEKNRSRYSPMIDSVAQQTRIRPELLHAVVRAESSYDPKARSRTGAMGLMQLMPGTAKRYGVKNSWDPQQNLHGGAQYLSDLLQMFNFDLRLALAAYNAGENAVIKYGHQIPPYPETQQYVSRVLGFYQENRNRGS